LRIAGSAQLAKSGPPADKASLRYWFRVRLIHPSSGTGKRVQVRGVATRIRSPQSKTLLLSRSRQQTILPRVTWYGSCTAVAGTRAKGASLVSSFIIPRFVAQVVPPHKHSHAHSQCQWHKRANMEVQANSERRTAWYKQPALSMSLGPTRVTEDRMFNICDSEQSLVLIPRSMDSPVAPAPAVRIVAKARPPARRSSGVGLSASPLYRRLSANRRGLWFSMTTSHWPPCTRI